MRDAHSQLYYGRMLQGCLEAAKGSEFGTVCATQRTLFRVLLLCRAATPGATLLSGASCAIPLTARTAQLADLKSLGSPGGRVCERRVDLARHHSCEQATKCAVELTVTDCMRRHFLDRRLASTPITVDQGP